MRDDEKTSPGTPSARRNSSSSIMLFSVLYEQLCRDLGVADDDAEARTAVRIFGMRMFDAGVGSAEREARRERARADYAEEMLRKAEQ